MAKKKTSKKRGLFLSDIPSAPPGNKKGLTPFDTTALYRDPKRVGEILLECLIEGELEEFMETLTLFLQYQTGKKPVLHRNPSIQTLARTLHPLKAKRSRK